MTERNIIRQNIMKGGAENGGNKRNDESATKYAFRANSKANRKQSKNAARSGADRQRRKDKIKNR